MGADLRNAEKEVAAIDRKITKLQAEIVTAHEALATHDQSDFTGLGELTALTAKLADEVATLEARWLELSEQIEASR
jgi:ABC transport system ATP-binding/permease protein